MCLAVAVGHTVCSLHGNVAVAVDAAPASAAVEALDVAIRVAAVGGVEVVQAAQLGIAHHGQGGGARVGHLVRVGIRARARVQVGARVKVRARIRVGARVGHQEKGLGPQPHAQRHGSHIVVGDLRTVLDGCWYGAARGRSRGLVRRSGEGRGVTRGKGTSEGGRESEGGARGARVGARGDEGVNAF